MEERLSHPEAKGDLWESFEDIATGERAEVLALGTFCLLTGIAAAIALLNFLPSTTPWLNSIPSLLLFVPSGISFVVWRRLRKGAIRKLRSERDAWVDYKIHQLRADARASAEEELRQWTPEVTASSTSFALNQFSLIQKDNQTGQPVAYLELLVTCTSRARCRVLVNGGKCQVWTLPTTPGYPVCTIDIGDFAALFDGQFAPGSATVRKQKMVELNDSTVAALKGGLAQALAASVTMSLEAAVETPGGNASVRHQRLEILFEIPPWVGRGAVVGDADA